MLARRSKSRRTSKEIVIENVHTNVIKIAKYVPAPVSLQ